MLLSRARLKAVNDQDIESLLISLGVKDDITNRKYRCHFCRTIITYENLQAIIKVDGYIRIICSMPKCIKKL